MRYFNGKLGPKDWLNKDNFIDENNVVVGYDSEQSCCENAGFYIVDKEPLAYTGTRTEIDPTKETLAPYRFDPAYFKELGTESEYDLDGGGAVSFRMHAPGTDKPDLYLVLYNSHNGYYGHGFSMDIGGVTKQSGSL